MDRPRKTLNTPKTKKNSPKSHKTGVSRFDCADRAINKKGLAL